MADRVPLRRLLDHTKNMEFPLRALEAVRELRKYLATIEREALPAARERGASVHDIAEALGVTRQAVYLKLTQIGGTGSQRETTDDIVEIPDIEPAGPTTNAGATRRRGRKNDPRLPGDPDAAERQRAHHDGA